METKGGPGRDQGWPTILILNSFGFKYGVPVDATFMLDVRFLPNPYWQKDLRPWSGLQQAVADYVLKSEQGASFLELLRPLVLFWATAESNGAKILRLAIGCTGGRHRSVAIVEHLQSYLADQGLNPTVLHRDLHRDTA